MNKHVLVLAAGFAAAASLLSGPALAQEDQTVAAANPNPASAVPAALAWRGQGNYDAASRAGSMYLMSRSNLLGRNVLDRGGRVLGPIINDARYLNGDLAGLEIALGGDRALWIESLDLRYLPDESLFFTSLSPEQTEERARLASNNPYPAS